MEEDVHFDDLFAHEGVPADSSQESLNAGTAGLSFCESDDEPQDDSQVSEATTVSDVTSKLESTQKASTARRSGRCSKHANDDATREGFNTLSSPSSTPRRLAANFEHINGEDSGQRSTLSVRDCVDHVFLRLQQDLLCRKDELAIELKVRPKVAPARDGAHDSSTGKDKAEAKTRLICFPGKTAEEAWRFTVVLRILELMHEALRAGVTLSKRDIYYRDPALFGNQSHVNRYVDDIAFTFGVPRASLNITAVAKGLVVGVVRFYRKDGSSFDAAADREGILVPNLKDILSVDMSKVKWIIVIEKEASFRSLASSNFWDRRSSEGVLITGKGYPDIATRALLRFLSTPSPRNGFASPPVYGLADFDPDGIAILSVYRHGSIALAHESEDLKVPDLKWLGLRSEHIMLAGDNTHASQGLLTLTPRDRAKARKMLERTVGEDGMEGGRVVRSELQTMLMLSVKAELQLLDALPEGLSDLLEDALRTT